MPSYDENSLEEWALLLSDDELSRELMKLNEEQDIYFCVEDEEKQDIIIEEMYIRAKYTNSDK